MKTFVSFFTNSSQNQSFPPSQPCLPLKPYAYGTLLITMLWRKRNDWEGSSPNSPAAIKFGVNAIRGYEKLVLLQSDPVSQDFHRKMGSIAQEVTTAETEDYDRLSKSLEVNVNAFSDKQRTAIEKSIETVYDSLYGVLRSLEDSIHSGDSLESKASGAAKRLDSLKSAKTYEEFLTGVQREVEVLNQAISAHREETKLIKTVYSAQVDSLRSKLRQAERAVKTDHLTKLGNRPAFELALSTAISSAEQGDHYCLAIIDLNNFKQINDRAGHLAGDAALVAFSGKLSETFASSGTSAYRLSGDEFTVIYKGGEVQLHAKLDRINNLFNRKPFMHNGLTIGISCSYGTVALRGNHTQESAIHEADLAMYRSKQQVKRSA